MSNNNTKNKQLPPPARNRLTRELYLLSTEPPPGVAAYLIEEDNMANLKAEITGPEGSPFENGVFFLSITIPQRYPFEPPRCRFLLESANILYHPNIDSAGRICLDTLKSPPAGSWSPAVSLPSLLLTIRTLLSAPNGDDPLDVDIAKVFRRDPELWRREARQRVEDGIKRKDRKKDEKNASTEEENTSSIGDKRSLSTTNDEKTTESRLKKIKEDM